MATITHIVIPLGTGSKKDNWELRYHLRSFQFFFSGELEITILGDPGSKPDWLTGVEYIEYPRYYPEGLAEYYMKELKLDSPFYQYENFFAVLRKVQLYVNSCAHKNIVVAYDDQLLLRPIDSFDMFDNLALIKVNMSRLKRNPSRHDKTIIMALQACNKHTDELFSYCNHSYRPYEINRLKRLFLAHPLDRQKIPYELSTLYYNTYFDRPKNILSEGCLLVGYLHNTDGINHEVPTTIGELDAMPYWMISYNDMGMDDLFVSWVESKFSTPSKYEK